MSDRLEEIKARAEKATPGPWSADDEHGDIPGAERAWCVSKITESGDYSHDIAYLSTDCADPIGTQETADAEFIAHAREDIPWLVAEVERLREYEGQIQPRGCPRAVACGADRY